MLDNGTLPNMDMEQQTGRADWFQIRNNRLVSNWERSTSRLYIITCLFNLYAEGIVQNAGLNGAQAGIKIAGRDSDSFR